MSAPDPDSQARPAARARGPRGRRAQDRDSSDRQSRHFDLAEDLPGPGRTVVEASAGTGKTYTLAALATRLIAEGHVEVDGLLVVTFTRAAAAELRDRLRRRLVGAVRHLDRIATEDRDASGTDGAASGPAHEEPAGHDPLHEALTGVDAHVRAQRRERLARAVIDFDTATITTIHGFCHQVLTTLGVTGGHDPDAVLVQDTGQVISAAATDVLASRSLAADPTPGRSKLTGWVRSMLNNPGLDVVALSGLSDDLAARDAALDSAARVRDRLLATGSVSYDGLLELVHEALVADPALARRLAAQFPVALIDEFQDTDPVQWAIFGTIYPAAGTSGSTPAGSGPPGSVGAATEAGGPTLVLVGDPKQAIYTFRGGDIHTYLQAVAEAGTRLSLPVNWRSDGALIDALNQLCDGLTLGDREVRYTAVEPGPANRGRRITDGYGAPLPAVELRCVFGDGLERTSRGALAVASARQVAVDDLAERVRHLLEGGAQIPDGTTDTTASRPSGQESPADGGPPAPGAERSRPLTCSDIAVLVHARSWCPQVQRALARHGIPSVIAGGSSVVEAPAAEQWRILVDALVRPADATRVRAYALSWFEQRDATDVAGTVQGIEASEADPSAGSEVLASLQSRLEGWAALLRDHGVAALVARLKRDTGVSERLLRRTDGERDLTDLEHIGELLHAASSGRPLGPDALRALLDGLAAEGEDEDPESIKRRIATDSDSVTIMTVHGAKGLEWPVVCLPSLWNQSATVKTRIYHDAVASRRRLDVSGDPKHAAVVDAHRAAKAEIQGQNDRLTYVALTRAVHHVLIWWAPAGNGAPATGVARVLFGEDPKGAAALPAEDETLEVLQDRINRLGLDGVVRAEQVDVARLRQSTRSAVPMAAAAPSGDIQKLEVATLGRSLDRTAGRWSFTAIAAVAEEEPRTDAAEPVESEVPSGVDPDDPTIGDAEDGDERRPAPPVLYDGLGAGAAFGSLVHDALEHLDFTSEDLEADLLAHLTRRSTGLVRPDSPQKLAAAIAASVRTPLGSAFAGTTLAGLDRSDRLDELEFELPLGVTAPVAASRIGEILSDHLPSDDPLRSWAQALAVGSIDVDLGGFLTGSVDLVMRRTDPSGLPGDATFSVVDYKTNRLGSWAAPDEVANYHPDRLAVAMDLHHYPLQAVLYSVALHRYLRWRLHDYDPQRHLGPVGYLFVRGMVGPHTPAVAGRVHGVFSWDLPAEAVVAVSDLLHGDPL